MPSNVHVSTAARNDALDAVGARLNGGFLRIYAGSQPSVSDAALGIDAVLLAELTFSVVAFTPAAFGSVVADTIGAGTAVADGIAAFFRCVESDTTTGVLDGSIGPTDADLIFDDTTIVTGTTVSISVFAMSMDA